MSTTCTRKMSDNKENSLAMACAGRLYPISTQAKTGDLSDGFAG